MFENHVILTSYVLFLNIFIILSVSSFVKIIQDFMTRKSYWNAKLNKFLGTESDKREYGSF